MRSSFSRSLPLFSRIGWGPPLLRIRRYNKIPRRRRSYTWLPPVYRRANTPPPHSHPPPTPPRFLFSVSKSSCNYAFNLDFFSERRCSGHCARRMKYRVIALKLPLPLPPRSPLFDVPGNARFKSHFRTIFIFIFRRKQFYRRPLFCARSRSGSPY